MPIIATGSDKEFSKAPEGIHNGVCCDVVDLGMRDTEHGQKHKVRLHWELDQADEDNRDKETSEAKPHTAVYTCNLTLGKGSKLRDLLVSWRGRDFTSEELQAFDLEALIGVNCKLIIEHQMKDGGRVYANVTKVLKPEKGSGMQISPFYVRFCDRDSDATNGGNATSGGGLDDDVPF